jgi:phosphoglycolate phosphatase/pyrophosphatase PpaX
MEVDMRYPCLVLDHDDTLVRSTPEIHYPSFVETVRLLRPGMPVLTLREFITYNFDPGFLSMCLNVYKFTDEEMKIEQEIWQRYTQRIPDCYEGFERLLARYRAGGGKVCVVSHSERRVILQHYRAHFGFEPELVFGWELPEPQRKPHPYPLDTIMETLGFEPGDLLMVDDLKLGLDMARSRGVDFAWAGWSDTAFVTTDFMMKNAMYCFTTPRELEEFLMGE